MISSDHVPGKESNRASLIFSAILLIIFTIAVIVAAAASPLDIHALLFATLSFLGRLGARLEVTPHHVAPRRDVASTRASNLELWLVNDHVLPHATLVDHGAASAVPSTCNHDLFVGVVFPDMLSPMGDVDVVDVQSLGTICPLALDHFQG